MTGAAFSLESLLTALQGDTGFWTWRFLGVESFELALSSIPGDETVASGAHWGLPRALCGGPAITLMLRVCERGLQVGGPGIGRPPP